MKPIEIRDPDEGSREWRMRNGKAQAGEIRFEHVWFAYKDDDYVIKDLNFTIHPGEKVALVGPTGAGKVPSSASVPPLRTQPRILVDGIDVRFQSELAVPHGVILQEGFHLPGM